MRSGTWRALAGAGALLCLLGWAPAFAQPLAPEIRPLAIEVEADFGAASEAIHTAQLFRFRGGGRIPPQALWMPAPAADSYILYVGTSSGVYTQSDDVGDVTFVLFVDTTLTLVPGTQYYLVVRSVLSAVESDDSNEVCFVWHGPNRRTTSC